MNIKVFKILSLSLVCSLVFSSCAVSSLENENKGAVFGGAIGAISGVLIGNKVLKGKNRKGLGAIAGAVIGAAIGHGVSRQAEEVAEILDTNVDNNADAELNPSKDLIVSHTDDYVKIVFRDEMMFKTNSSIPTSRVKQKILKVTEVLRAYPNTLVQIVGHTDNRGSYDYNKELSEQRASNVGEIIYNSNVSNSIFAKGCSFDKPIVLNNSDENMALNRRVEVYLYENRESIIDICD